MDRTPLQVALARPVDDGLERVHVDRCRALLEAWPRCLASDHFDPGHFTASAFVLSPARDAVLMIHHAKLMRWLQPGGHIEAEDVDVEAATRREILEETGLAAMRRLTPPGELFDVDVHRIPARKDAPAHWHFDLRLLYVAECDDVAALDGVSEACFIPLDDLRAAVREASLSRPLEKIQAQLLREAHAGG